MAKTVYATGDIPTAANFNAFTQEANAAITGGTINSTVIGGTTPAAGSFTTLAASGGATITGVSSITRTGVNGAGAASVVSVASDGKTAGDAVIFPLALQNASSAAKTYASLSATIVSPTAGAEYGSLKLNVLTNGSSTAPVTITDSLLAVTGAITASTTIKTGGYTVATLPAAGAAGRRAYVTDALLPLYNTVLTGAGAVVVPVFDNGVAWVSA